MADQEIDEADGRERWEREASDEYGSHLARPTAELVADIRAQRYGTHYQLWHVVGEKASLAEAGWPLFRVVKSDAPYLVRYHAAGALLKLLGGIAGYGPVHLSREDKRLPRRLEIIERVLRARVGPPEGSVQT